MSSKYDKATTGNEIHLQSKDLYGAAYVFRVGKKITVTWGDLEFESNSDAKWEGCEICPHCNNLDTFDITIKGGVITEVSHTP